MRFVYGYFPSFGEDSMPKTLGFMGFPSVTPAEVHRFERAARINDREAFAAELNALIHEKVALVEEQGSTTSTDVAESLVQKARALRAETPWAPSATDLQRGRSALLKVFDQPQNLPLPEFAKLAHKSRQQIYKDLAAHPRRLLALSVGPRRQKLPEWQLDPVRLRLTQKVLERAEDLDDWTIFHALAEPLDALAGKSPVEAVHRSNLDAVAEMVYSVLDLH
jgi:hypothetical protein